LNYYQELSGDFESFATGATVTAASPSWNHFAVVRNETDKTIATYKNGVLVSTNTYLSTLVSTTNDLTLGSRPGGGLNMNGSLDEVRIWHTVRTASEIANHYACEVASNETGLLAYYKFNQGMVLGTNTGVTTLTDATSNARTGTLTNFALTGATSNWNAGYSSLGTPITPSVSIAASPSGTITAGTSVTFTATPTHSGSAPTYVWKKGGVPIGGQTAATYTSNTLANGDVITCVVTSSLPCASPTTATSTGITMTVTGPFTYTWTGATSTDWATATNWNPNGIPTSTDNIIIPTTANKPMLPANQTIANLSLTGTNKIMLGNHNLCVNAITGGSSSSYVVTNGTGSLIIKALPTNAATTFPIGASETSYDPLSIHPTNSVDFTAKVKATAVAGDFTGSIANFAKTAKRQWDITPTGNAGSTVLTLTNGGTAYTIVGTPKVGHYSGTAWTELAATHNNSTWTATTSSFSPFGVGEAGGFVTVLPVELLTFTGYNKGGVNILNWETAHEVNNKGFEVERLNVTGNVWDILGFVNAKGKGSSYDFMDNAPLSTSYYRLRQIDNDGKETYSKVISVSSKGSDKLKVYPNPVSNVLTVETTEQGDFQILNLLGQQVLTGKTPPLGAGVLDVSALPQGSYFLKVGAEQVKFVKQ
jgi:hypothetical protein